MVLIVFWQGIGSFLGNYYLARVSLGLINDLRRTLFGSLFHLPNTYFDQNNSGHLISRIAYNVTMVTGAATDAIKIMIREGLTVVFLFGYLIWMNWKLTPCHGCHPPSHRHHGQRHRQEHSANRKIQRR